MSFELQLKRVYDESARLKDGELAVDDTNTNEPKIYVGDGVRKVAELGYVGKTLTNSTLNNPIIAGGRVNSATLDRCELEGNTINNGTLSGGTILATMSDKLTNYTATETNQLQGYLNADKNVYTIYISLKDVPSDASIILITGYWSQYISTSRSPFMLMCIRTWSGWECSPIKLGGYPPLEFTFTDMNDNIIPGYPNDTPRLELDVVKESYMLISYSRVAINVLI